MDSVRGYMLIATAFAVLLAAGRSDAQSEQDAAQSSQQQMERIHHQVLRMQQQVIRMSKATDATERRRILREHIETVREHMRDMYSIAGEQRLGAMMEDCMARTAGEAKPAGQQGSARGAR